VVVVAIDVVVGVDVDVAIDVVVDDGVNVGVDVDVVLVVTLVSGFAGARITNFNSRERVTTKTAEMIREIAMIERRCRHLDRLLIPSSISKYARFLCIFCFTRTSNLKQKTNCSLKILYICLLLLDR
jgi:hypothetical protein